MTLQVCAVVQSILAAFSNGIDISQKIAARKSKKNFKNVETSKEEQQLRDSLLKRPQEIKTEYEKSVVRHGQQFEVGDPQSHSRLAQTLLVMNTGLIEIINYALSGSSKAKAVSRKSLLDLSEIAAADTMSAFVQLNDRLTVSSQIRLEIIPCSPAKQTRQSKTRPKTDLPAPAERPGPSPLLVRGGWVRSKSGSSVVSASSARRKAARKEDHKHSETIPVIPICMNAEVAEKPLATISDETTVSKYKSDRAPQSPWSKKLFTDEIKVEPPPYTQRRPPSMLIVPADYFETYDLVAQQNPPPRPPKIPLHSRPHPTSRARPLSGATFMTASTKIGEIPEDRLPDRILSAEERERIPLPYVIPPPLLEEPKKKRWGFRLWKKQTLAVC